MSEQTVTPDSAKVNLLLARLAAQAKRYEEELVELRIQALVALQEKNQEIDDLRLQLEELRGSTHDDVSDGHEDTNPG